VDDMVRVVLNIGNLVRKVFGTGIVFLIDEAQALDGVKKRTVEIHDAFLQLASDDNSDVGFVIAYFGGGADSVPKVFRSPDDILTRLGVSQSNIHIAIKDLGRLITKKDDIIDFINRVLDALIIKDKAQELISEKGLTGKVKPEKMPFTEGAIERIVQVLYQKEQNRNARMIIGTLADLSAKAYQKAKLENKYIAVDREFVEPLIKDL